MDVMGQKGEYAYDMTSEVADDAQTWSFVDVDMVELMMVMEGLHVAAMSMLLLVAAQLVAVFGLKTAIPRLNIGS